MGLFLLLFGLMGPPTIRLGGRNQTVGGMRAGGAALRGDLIDG